MKTKEAKYEEDILTSFEKGEWQSVPNLKAEIARYAASATATLAKDKRIKIAVELVERGARAGPGLVPGGDVGRQRFRFADLCFPAEPRGEGYLPSASDLRQHLAHIVGAPAAGIKPVNSRPMPLIPVPDIAEVLAEGDRAAFEGSFDTSMEPVPSAFFEELESPAGGR